MTKIRIGDTVHYWGGKGTVSYINNKYPGETTYKIKEIGKYATNVKKVTKGNIMKDFGF